jgi:hypothetical protein
VFATMVAKHLEIGKAKYPVIVVSLKKVMHWIDLRNIYNVWCAYIQC